MPKLRREMVVLQSL